MTIREILNTTDHRPWAVPNESWKYYQEWNHSIFLHWQVELSELQKFVPKELEIDLFEGKPWVSVVAFTMEEIRPKNLPAFSPISNFDEINIRTYIKSNNKTGVYFLSIEGGTSLSCKIAKGMSELPYRFSKMKRTENKFKSSNSEFNDTFEIEFEIGKAVTQKNDLDKWLTERYALYQDSEKSMNEFEIHHLEWPIHEVDLKKVEVNYPRFDTLIKTKPHKIQYSNGVKVIAWGKNKKSSYRIKKMKTKSRIESILKANSLDFSITGLRTFNLSELELADDLEFELPTNIRLGHLAEKIVSELIKSSANYNVLYENIQLIEDKKTIGEIDFIVEEIASCQITHLELAYKFYLFDPSISSKPINNWIGPNRNDSLREKLEKLKQKQLPLLYHNCAKAKFNNIEIEEVSQAICLFVSLFVPYEYKGSFSPIYEKAIQGFYFNFETFSSLDNSEKKYHLPPKKEWGMNPSENENWTDFSGVENFINASMKERQASLCWQKWKDSYLAFFIVWW